MDGLAEEDRANIMAKFSGAQTQTMEEQNELMMMLLRAHCESKQLNHTHDTEQNRLVVPRITFIHFHHPSTIHNLN
jgi:hypothetical protein